MTKSESLPTYAEIAVRANVSIKTVCNVFRTPDIVRTKTMNKVLVALKELGVKDPGAMSAKLRPARSPQANSLLFLVNGMDAGWLSAPIFAKIIQSAEMQAHEKGWQLSLRHGHPDEDLSETLKNYRGGGVILFGPSIRHRELVAALPKVAAVRLLAAPEGGMDCDNVDYDRAETSRIAARYLHDRGCRKVAYMGPAHPPRGGDFLAAAKSMGMSVIDGTTDALFVAKGSSQTVDRDGLLAAWKAISEKGPDGIFLHSDHITNALYPLLEKQGIKPGKDLHVISCNADEVFLSPLHPRPATIDLHPADIGRRGIDQILWKMQNADAPPSKIIIWPQLVPGEDGHGLPD